MNKLQLDFVCAYAEVYDLINECFSEVLNRINYDIKSSRYFGENSAHPSPQMFMEEFMRCYNSMKEYKLDEEVKSDMKTQLIDFFEACREWDIL